MRELPIAGEHGGRELFADSGTATMLCLAAKSIAIAMLMLLAVSRLPSHSLAPPLLMLSTSMAIVAFEGTHRRRNRAGGDRRLADRDD
jgi:hypothetical protein